MPPETLIVIHERRGRWARQLRPRLPDPSIRWSETRSAGELEEACRPSACPILVLDLGDRPARALEDLARSRWAAPGLLTLVLDPGLHPEAGPIARELGATLILPGAVVPPTVVGLLRRWLPLARERAGRAGWMPPIDRDEPLSLASSPL